MTTSDTHPPVTTTNDTGDTGVQTTTSGDSTGASETGTSECNAATPLDPACTDPALPYCGPDGSCVPCGAIDCGVVTPATPSCDAASGKCVQCTAAAHEACGGATPICDAATAKCVGCTRHDQCDSKACQLKTGACFEQVLYVDRGLPCDGADGSMELPFCEINDAVAKIGAGDPTAVLVKANAIAYSEQIQVAAERTLAIVRLGSGTAKLEVGALDSLVVNDNSVVYLDQLQISKGDVSKGIFCNGGSMWIDRTQIVDRKGLGVEGLNCALRLRQSRIYLNLGGGLKLTGGSVYLENSFIVSNGGSFAAVSGVVLSNGATLNGLYTTLADNDGKAGVEDSLDCSNAGPVTLRNAILFGQSAATSVDCANATAIRSVVDAMALKGADTQLIDALDPAWFVSPETGNFQIKAGMPFEDVAVWMTGDPLVDYDGDPRPKGDGDPDYAGADRPK
ncbi:MAG: hypothetical protein IPO88_18200 [Nannocystis sp.]|uniref:hypothetical protein n=1 Tax=Nannocystis sp. TaxID=1962667 RepID=UPI002428517A|nr:hypothetical protein [Nannocystis sp.]MBK9755398.1 hypothetical protein [Nannocystis sp.]